MSDAYAGMRTSGKLGSPSVLTGSGRNDRVRGCNFLTGAKKNRSHSKPGEEVPPWRYPRTHTTLRGGAYSDAICGKVRAWGSERLPGRKTAALYAYGAVAGGFHTDLTVRPASIFLASVFDSSGADRQTGNIISSYQDLLIFEAPLSGVETSRSCLPVLFSAIGDGGGGLGISRRPPYQPTPKTTNHQDTWTWISPRPVRSIRIWTIVWSHVFRGDFMAQLAIER